MIQQNMYHHQQFVSMEVEKLIVAAVKDIACNCFDNR